MPNAQTTLIAPVKPGQPGPITQHEIVLDTNGSDFTYRTPLVADERIYVLGFQVVSSTAGVLTFKRGATTILTYSFLANTGAGFKAGTGDFVFYGDAGQAMSIATTGQPVSLIIHTVEAREWGNF